jgi:hypothetical protein
LRGHWNAQYVLEMSDGTQIDVFTAEPGFGAGYPGLVQALRGKAIVFDSRYVAKDCGHGDASYLFYPPQ